MIEPDKPEDTNESSYVEPIDEENPIVSDSSIEEPENQVVEDIKADTKDSTDEISDEEGRPTYTKNEELKEGIEGVKDENESGSDIEQITEFILDSAEAANSAAVGANNSSQIILNSVTQFQEITTDSLKKAKILFATFCGVLIISASVGGVILERLRTTVDSADAIVLAVGKKVIELDGELKKLDSMQNKLVVLDKTNKDLKKRFENAIAVFNKIYNTTKEREDRVLNTLIMNIKQSNDVLQEKTGQAANQVVQLGKKINGLKRDINSLKNQKLLKKLDALITLEQSRYYERLSASPEIDKQSTKKNPQLQYPMKGGTEQ